MIKTLNFSIFFMKKLLNGSVFFWGKLDKALSRYFIETPPPVCCCLSSFCILFVVVERRVGLSDASPLPLRLET